MAYMTKDGFGPYPNKAGEYCGNYLPESEPLPNLHKSLQEETQQRQEDI